MLSLFPSLDFSANTARLLSNVRNVMSRTSMQPLSFLQIPLYSSLIAVNGPSCPRDLPLSCHNTSQVGDLCCFNYPGGQLLQTQFWDYSPSTGPVNSWTIHGLWCVIRIVRCLKLTLSGLITATVPTINIVMTRDGSRTSPTLSRLQEIRSFWRP